MSRGRVGKPSHPGNSNSDVCSEESLNISESSDLNSLPSCSSRIPTRSRMHYRRSSNANHSELGKAGIRLKDMTHMSLKSDATVSRQGELSETSDDDHEASRARDKFIIHDTESHDELSKRRRRPKFVQEKRSRAVLDSMMQEEFKRGWVQGRESDVARAQKQMQDLHFSDSYNRSVQFQFNVNAQPNKGTQVNLSHRCQMGCQNEITDCRRTIAQLESELHILGEKFHNKEVQNERLKENKDVLEQEICFLEDKITIQANAAIEQVKESLNEKIASLTKKNDILAKKIADLMQMNETLEEDNVQLVQLKQKDEKMLGILDHLAANGHSLDEQNGALRQKVEQLEADLKQAEDERDRALAGQEIARDECDRALADREMARDERDSALQDRDALAERQDQMQNFLCFMIFLSFGLYGALQTFRARAQEHEALQDQLRDIMDDLHPVAGPQPNNAPNVHGVQDIGDIFDQTIHLLYFEADVHVPD
ncbi:protein CROWDED NUCLEI 4-like isoform X2 [Dendronephthya gigantea]|uniref:protein CROWDED NUCLEI 4-like isoform X2 n=1 Tax=Dendronephthya gigantea TaxID=151771 RepID=UPI00106D00F3|nr:protein CROWDED NUCLEI 4-like isoform X2 [Dendronephthya gigantea]